MKYPRRMGKATACPSIKRIGVDGHVVPPLPILRWVVLAVDAALDEMRL
jgi:hypothetical protein